MACSKFEYVKQYESQERLLPSTYIVIRIDGKGFTKFTTLHGFEKPNDIRGIDLMNKAAQIVVQTFPEIWLAYGESDEYSFVLRKNSTLYNRRPEKISTTIVSCFSSSYALSFKEFFPDHELKEIPMFDGRCVCYPNDQTIRDYFSWRQADCHINNMYNTCFWSLVQQGGYSVDDAHKFLKGTDSATKNEMLFSKYGINYAKIDAIWRKGTIFLRVPEEKKEESNIAGKKELVKDSNVEQVEEAELTGELQEANGDKDVKVKGPKKGKGNLDKPKEVRQKFRIVKVHEDLIGDEFWIKYKESTLL